MGTEIEAKMRVDDHAAVTARLEELGAVFVAAMLERDTFFDTPDGELVEADRGLRVRWTDLYQ